MRRVTGHDVHDEADAVRAAIAVTGQFSAVDNLLTGEQNLADGPAAPPQTGPGSSCDRPR
jgi:hypothetical protein